MPARISARVNARQSLNSSINCWWPAAGAATDTHLYVCGGYSSGRYDTVYATSVNADGSLASWMTAGAMLTGRAGHGVVIVNETVPVGLVPSTFAVSIKVER